MYKEHNETSDSNNNNWIRAANQSKNDKNNAHTAHRASILGARATQDARAISSAHLVWLCGTSPQVDQTDNAFSCARPRRTAKWHTIQSSGLVCVLCETAPARPPRFNLGGAPVGRARATGPGGPLRASPLDRHRVGRYLSLSLG